VAPALLLVRRASLPAPRAVVLGLLLASRTLLLARLVFQAQRVSPLVLVSLLASRVLLRAPGASLLPAQLLVPETLILRPARRALAAALESALAQPVRPSCLSLHRSHEDCCDWWRRTGDPNAARFWRC